VAKRVVLNLLLLKEI